VELASLSIFFVEYGEDALPWFASTLCTVPPTNKLAFVSLDVAEPPFILDTNWRLVDSELGNSRKFNEKCKIEIVLNTFHQYIPPKSALANLMGNLAPRLAVRENTVIYSDNDSEWEIVDWRPTDGDMRTVEDLLSNFSDMGLIT
jgi:hypothetical protein